MLIDDIDFADLYLQQLKLAHRTEKTPAHWDQRAEKISFLRHKSMRYFWKISRAVT